VRLSRLAKRLRKGSLAKSSSDTAECLWTQSDHDIFSNPNRYRQSGNLSHYVKRHQNTR
jgi:hypothetical protein